MKRAIILILLIPLLLCSCVSESKNCDIFKLAQRINSISGNELIKTDELIADDNNVIYWFPSFNKQSCVSFYINDKNGNIEKCNIIFKNKKEDKSLTDIINNALEYNNKYFEEEKYITEKYLAVHLEDTRYIKRDNDLTLKKDIIEEDLY